MNNNSDSTNTSSKSSENDYKNKSISQKNLDEIKNENILPIENEKDLDEKDFNQANLKNIKKEKQNKIDKDRLYIENCIFYIKIFVVIFILSSMILTVCFFSQLKAAFIQFIEYLKHNIYREQWNARDTMDFFRFSFP